MNCVGIDIHKRYSVCAAQDEQGRELGMTRIEGNSGPDFGRFLRGLGGTCRVAIEACWNWGAVFEVLEGLPEVAEVVVANPLKARLNELLHSHHIIAVDSRFQRRRHFLTATLVSFPLASFARVPHFLNGKRSRAKAAKLAKEEAPGIAARQGVVRVGTQSVEAAEHLRSG